MAQNETATPDKILNAAKTEFYQQGYKGARMQQIADTAGINKSLLHYYFRSKKQLYQAVLEDSFESILPKLVNILNEEPSFYDKIERFIEVFLQHTEENPQFATFLFTEVSQTPHLIRKYLNDNGPHSLDSFYQQFQEEITSGNVYFMSPQHFVINLFAVCTYPLAAEPFVKELLQFDEEEYEKWRQKRKKELTRFIFNGLKPSAHK